MYTHFLLLTLVVKCILLPPFVFYLLHCIFLLFARQRRLLYNLSTLQLGLDCFSHDNKLHVDKSYEVYVQTSSQYQ